MIRIQLSNKYGVNPAIPKCYFCLENKNEIILTGRLSNDCKAPQGAVWDTAPCDQCKKYIAEGVILISVANGESNHNPYRTGGWVVVTEDAVRRIFHGKTVDDICKKRVSFVFDEVWDAIGLPRN